MKNRETIFRQRFKEKNKQEKLQLKKPFYWNNCKNMNVKIKKLS